MTDWPAALSIIAAITACAGALIAIIFDVWTYRRKQGRRRVGALVAQANWNADILTHQVVHEFARLHLKNDLELQRQLRLDLEKLALLAIMDEKIIGRAADELSQEFHAGRAAGQTRTKILDFFGEWMASQTPLATFPLPKEIDPLRGQYEFAKKRKMLFQAIHRAIA